MNEQLQTALAEMLGKANAGIDAGATFLQAQLPDVIQQLLVWKAVVSGLLCLLSVVALIGITVAIIKVLRNQEYWDGCDMPPAVLVAGFMSILYFIPAAVWNIDWLQIWLAPKIYLIEYAASLAK